MKYSFVVKIYKIGAVPVFESLSQHLFLFCTKGTIHLHSDTFDSVILSENEMISMSCGSEFYLVVLDDVTLLFHYFEELKYLCVSCRHVTKNSGNTKKSAYIEPRHGMVLPTSHPVLVFIHSVLMYLEYGPPNEHLCKIKHCEISNLLHTYYDSDELFSYLDKICSVVSPFRYLVLKHYRHAKSTKDLACLCNYGLHSFRRIFKVEFGIPPYTWLIQMRAERIKLRLAIKYIPFIEIMDEFHFLSASHFSVFCKRYLGDTPQNIRKLLLK